MDEADQETVNRNVRVLFSKDYGVDQALAQSKLRTDSVLSEGRIMFDTPLKFEYDSDNGALERVFTTSRPRDFKGDNKEGTVGFRVGPTESNLYGPVYALGTSSRARSVLNESFMIYNLTPEGERKNSEDEVAEKEPETKKGCLGMFLPWLKNK